MSHLFSQSRVLVRQKGRHSAGGEGGAHSEHPVHLGRPHLASQSRVSVSQNGRHSNSLSWRGAPRDRSVLVASMDPVVMMSHSGGDGGAGGGGPGQGSPTTVILAFMLACGGQ